MIPIWNKEYLLCRQISLVVSVRHTPAEKTMQRVPSKVSAAVFGVKITSLARREGKTVPTIVTACLQEVEKRGETGYPIWNVLVFSL